LKRPLGSKLNHKIKLVLVHFQICQNLFAGSADISSALSAKRERIFSTYTGPIAAILRVHSRQSFLQTRKKIMRLYFAKHICHLVLLMLLPALPAFAQSTQVDIGKQVSRIPRVCELVVPASIEGTVDIPALVKEANCKGAGDMMTEYSYVLNSLGRSKDKKGQTKTDSTTYEVFIPILKSGTHARGILVMTHRNGAPVPADELEKARTEAGERLEKAEEKNSRETGTLPESGPVVNGMLPLGMYTSTTSRHSSFRRNGSATLAIHTFLKTCVLTLVRRGQRDGRYTLIFTFAPRPDAQLRDSEKYITQLTGEIWIDAQDHIVTRLIGWPSVSPDAASLAPGERPPAVYVEMMRLPEGIWLPRVVRINGADYPRLFDGINRESISTFSNYIRFSTEIKDVKVNP
jgi:hypothetical protein